MIRDTANVARQLILEACTKYGASEDIFYDYASIAMAHPATGQMVVVGSVTVAIPNPLPGEDDIGVTSLFFEMAKLRDREAVDKAVREAIEGCRAARAELLSVDRANQLAAAQATASGLILPTS